MRVPGGLLTAAQVDVLADAAERLGTGTMSLTARGNVEIRGLSEAAGAELGALLQGAGVLPSPTHERVRNIVVSPTAGLDDPVAPAGSSASSKTRGSRATGRSTGAAKPSEHGASADLTAVVRALDGLLIHTPRTADLSGRFLFGLDDGRGDVLALDPDLAARWIGRTGVEIVIGGRAVLVADASDVPQALVTAACAFLDARDATGETGWRLAELDDDEPVVRAIVEALVDAEPARVPDAGFAPAPHHDGAPVPPGRVGATTVHLVLPLGEAPAATWRALAGVARHGDGLLRTTPWRSVLLAGLECTERDALLARAEELGLVADPGDPTVGATACTGLPGCASSRADVRDDLRTALAASATGTSMGEGTGAHPGDANTAAGPVGDSGLDSLRAGDPVDGPAAPGRDDRLPLHVSGCERRCGHPRREHLEAVATGDGYAVGRTDGSPAAGAPPSPERGTVAELLATR